MAMKIAAVSDDGKTISAHFGRASLYVVLTVEDGNIIQRELRQKLGHDHFTPEQHEHAEHQQLSSAGHGFSPAEQDRHSRMLDAVLDCQILLARGMGSGAYYSIQQAGLTPMVTTISDIDTAALEAARGTLADHPEKLH